MGANAGTAVPVYASGEVLTAARLNLTNCGVPVFSGTATRDAAFGGSGEKVLAEGQLCYLEDANVVQYYDSASWLTVGPTTAKILQVVSTTKTDSFSTSSTSYVDVTGLSVTITPTSASSTILVLTGVAMSGDNNSRMSVQLKRGTTDIAISTGFATTNQTSASFNTIYMSQYVSIAHVDSPATTSATTYKFQAKVSAGGGTGYINAQNGSTTHGNVSTLTVMEISA